MMGKHDGNWSNLPGEQGGRRFSVLCHNEALQSAHYRGQFDTVEQAQEYCVREAERSRAFVTLQPVDNFDGRKRASHEPLKAKNARALKQETTHENSA